MSKGFDRLRGIAAASALGLSAVGGGSARAASTALGITHTAAGVAWQNINNGVILDSSFTSLTTNSGIHFSSSSAGMLIGNASLTSGIDNAFNGALFMATLQSGTTKIFTNPDTTVDLTNNTLTSDLIPGFLSNIDAQIEYYFHPSRSVVRALYSFDNTSASDITFSVYIGGNLASGNSTNIQSTSDDDSIVESSDLWIISSNRSIGTDPVAGTSDTPVITISRFGRGASEPGNGVPLANGAGTFGHLYNITVPANSTRRIMVFAELSATIDDAKNNATSFETLANAEAAGLLSGFISNNVTFDEIINYTENPDDDTSNPPANDEDDGKSKSTGTFTAHGIVTLLALLTLTRIKRCANRKDKVQTSSSFITRPPDMSKAFQTQAIFALLNAEPYEQALQQSLQWLDESPARTEALYLCGLAYLLTGQHAKSIQKLRAAIEKKPDDAIYITNLGIALLRADEVQAAIEQLQQAIKIQPDYEMAHYNLGSAYIKNRQIESAVAVFEHLYKSNPKHGEYTCALADATREQGQWSTAIKLYRETLELNPAHYRAHANLGPLLMYLGQLERAIEHCKQAISLEPELTLARKNLGDCYMHMEQLDDAMESYADAYEINNNDSALCSAIGNVWLETADLREAATWFQKAVLLDDKNVTAFCGLAAIDRNTGELSNALAILTPLHEAFPDNVELLLSLTDTYWDDGDIDSALRYLTAAQKLQPQRALIYVNTAHLLASSGDIENALIQYRAALEHDPLCIPALHGYAMILRKDIDRPHIEKLREQLTNESLKPGALATTHNALALYYDDNSQFEQAARHMQQAKNLQWQHKSARGWQYDTDQHETLITKLIKTFDEGYFKKFARKNDNTDTINPIFIVAMPRSGTTLTEQILASHHRVLGIGERNFASQSFNRITGYDDSKNYNADEFAQIRQLEQNTLQSIRKNYCEKLYKLKSRSGKTKAHYIVDKMPDNYMMIGWILTLFPAAKIIHVRREPSAVALSCWMTQFGSIRWACKKHHLSHRLKQYQRIMQHWKKVIPEQVLEVNYEQLVMNPEQESKRLIEYIGLDWDKNCLKFYQSEHIIRSASITQVRQPIYKESIAHWQHYRSVLADLFDAS